MIDHRAPLFDPDFVAAKSERRRSIEGGREEEVWLAFVPGFYVVSGRD